MTEQNLQNLNVGDEVVITIEKDRIAKIVGFFTSGEYYKFENKTCANPDEKFAVIIDGKIYLASEIYTLEQWYGISDIPGNPSYQRANNSFHL